MDVVSNRSHSALYSPLQMTILNHSLLPVVLFVPVVLQRVVIDQVEEQHASSSQLEHGSDPTVLGQLIFVVPPPIRPAHGSCNGAR